MEQLQPILIMLGASVVTALILWLMTNWALFLNEARKNTQMQQVITLVGQGVQMVEQQFGSLDNEAKKAEATKWVMEQASLLGLSPNETLVSGLIEAAVYVVKSIK